MSEELAKKRKEKINQLQEIMKNIFSNMGRVVMDIAPPQGEWKKKQLFEAIKFQISLARDLLERLKEEYPALLSPKEEREILKDLKKKVESAKEIAEELEKEREV